MEAAECLVDTIDAFFDRPQMSLSQERRANRVRLLPPKPMNC